MPTKSFQKNISIKGRNSIKNFINALESAEKKKSKEVNLDNDVEDIKDGEQIRELFHY